RMPGQTWAAAAASFVAMWAVMMMAMMLPSLLPALWRYRQVACTSGGARAGRLTALAGIGYLFVWTAPAFALFPLGVALAAIEMQLNAVARAVPFAAAAVVVIAGIV